MMDIEGYDEPLKRKRNETNEQLLQAVLDTKGYVKKRKIDYDELDFEIFVHDIPDDFEVDIGIIQWDVIVIDPLQYYGIITGVEAERSALRVDKAHRWSVVDPQVLMAAQAAQRVYYRITFDCFLSGWFDMLSDDPTAWPDFSTIARTANSIVVEVVLTEEQFNAMNNREGPVLGETLPALVEGSWWWLKFQEQIPQNGEYVLATVSLPELDSDNPLTIAFAEREVEVPIVDLAVPLNLQKLVRFSHGWNTSSGFEPEDPPYPM